jgi:TolB-like protein/DNA-binding winged helix-turn-helix (wHTH) protein/Tfp pilus assembly protein PilF
VAASSYKFGEFELDVARYQLRREGRPVKLERIPMELLILLAEEDGHVVPRQAIVERLWGKDVFVDTEHGINTAIRKVRTALREDGERPRFVQTVQGKGYRLVVDGKGESVASPPAPEPLPHAPGVLEPGPFVSPPATASSASAVVTRGRPRLRAIAGALLLAAVLAVGLNVGGMRERLSGGGHLARIQSIAVLPLANLSGDASQDYFADGMTDELITMLARLSSLRVVSRTSAMQYKGARRPLPEIARELGVDAVLEGSLERSGNRVHVTVQLIDARSDNHIWAQSYDRTFSDALSLPSELSQAIAKEVRFAASPPAPSRPVNPDAHDAYLHGRYFWFNDDYGRSQEYFEKAIALQPDYALAWCGLADAYIVRAVASLVPPREVAGKAREAARRALELDDSVGEAHNTMAAVHLFADWDWKAADEESRRAIELSPQYAEARHLHSYVLFAMNRPDDALQEQRLSTEMDPIARPWALGLALLRTRRFDDAVSELRLRAEAQPRDQFIPFILSDAYWSKGLWKEAVAERERGLRITGNTVMAAAVREAFASGGRTAVVELAIKNATDRARKAYVSPWALATWWARLEKKEETLRFLEEAYQERSAPLVFLQSSPGFDFLHSDERYQAIVRKVGLPPAY